MSAPAEMAPQPPSRLVLLGDPVAHSLSPVFQTAALSAAGLHQRYEAVRTTALELPERMKALVREGAGGNVTIPHKEAVFTLAVRRSALADRVGAVNTFWCEADGLVGHNTDVEGVERALDALLPGGSQTLRDRPVVLFGAGGSAAAALVALERIGAGSVRVYSRNPDRATSLLARVGVSGRVYASAAEAARGAALAINATPLGLHDDEWPLDPAALAAGTAVFDLVYRPGETAWVRAARAAGLPAGDGLVMLVEQGAAAFRSWFGIEPDREAMWGALAHVRPRPARRKAE